VETVRCGGILVAVVVWRRAKPSNAFMIEAGDSSKSGCRARKLRSRWLWCIRGFGVGDVDGYRCGLWAHLALTAPPSLYLGAYFENQYDKF
jgi:hypothetical protein